MSKKLLIALARNLITYLTEQKKLEEYFSFDDVSYHTSIIKQEIMQTIAKMLKFTCKEEVKQYKFGTNSIIRFVLLELSISKSIYMKSEFMSILKDTLQIYLPVGVQIPDNIEQLGQYFIEIKKHNHILHYDPLLLEASIKERMKFMEKHKKRYSLTEIKGIFYGIDGLDISEICHKHFRKYGDEYELKLITGKA